MGTNFAKPIAILIFINNIQSLSRKEPALTKLIKICFLLFGSVFFLLSGTVFAFPFLEVEGFVDPIHANYHDIGDGLIQVDGLKYSFIVDYSAGDAEMSYLSLEFENDVFESVSNPFNYEPGDWANSLTNSAGSGYILSFAGTTIGIGEQLSFMVNVVMYADSLTDSSLWNEGQVWAQSWSANDTLNGSDGGSTAPVPEPATMLLLGTGLIGLAGFGRKKFINK